MASFEQVFPPVETVLEMEPEELAPFVLKHISETPSGGLNRYNYSLGTGQDFVVWVGTHREEIMHRLMVAWMWLEKELFVAPKPGQQGDWAFITPRGLKVLESQDFGAYKKGSLLPSDNLDPVLVRKVKPSFIRGDYDIAVFEVMKEVEVRVRKKAGLNASDIGVALMRKAFGNGGPLVDITTIAGEQQALMDLFAGAIGTYKNPSSHRNVEFTDPAEVAGIIHTANQLLRIVDRI